MVAILSRPLCVNSLKLGDAYLCPQTASLLVQVMNSLSPGLHQVIAWAHADVWLIAI